MSTKKEKEDFRDHPLEVYNSIFKDDILKEKYAFITGGGSGINFRITEALMKHGCDVAIASRNIERVETAAKRLKKKYPNRTCLYFAMDVSDDKQIGEVVSKILQSYPRIDILVNGAAGNFLAWAENLSANAFKKVFEIDTFGTFNTCKQVFEQSMKHHAKTHGAVILNITATLSLAGTMLQSHAGSAKAAIDALTRHLSVEWGQYNIRVNSVAPGPIEDTLGFDKLGGALLSPSKNSNNIDSKFLKDMAYGPITRAGTSKEIADACVFLVSDAATYITGICLVIDGGHWMTSSNNIGKLLLLNPALQNVILKPKKEGKSKL